MVIKRLSLTARTLYAELRELALAGLEGAKRDLLRRGPSWRAKWARALKKVERIDGEVSTYLQTL